MHPAFFQECHITFPRLPFLSASLVAVAFLELAARASDLRGVQHVTWIAMALVLVFSLRRLQLREVYLLLVCLVLSVLIVMRSDEAGRILVGALDQASFLMAFILLLGMLHSTAATSPAIAVIGEYLTRQRPGRRYFVLKIGTGVMAVLFNVGIVSFLVPLVQKGIERAAPNDPLNPIRERRQIAALLRGFAWAVVWSPTAMAPMVLVELMPEVSRFDWIVYGLMIFVPVVLIGGLEDSIRFRRYRLMGKRKAMPFPRIEARNFASVSIGFFAVVAVIVWLSGETVVFGVLAACPIVVLVWLAVQTGESGDVVGNVTSRLREIATVALPHSATVSITLACSGFIGRAAAGLVPAQELAAFLGLEDLPDFVLLSLIPPALSLFSLLALSPTMMAVFFGSLFAALPVMPVDPTLAALSISCGWALSMTFSPFATVALIVDRASGIPARTLTWGWNLAFTLACAVLLVPFFALLTGGT